MTQTDKDNMKIAEFMGAVIEQWYPANGDGSQSGLHAVYSKDSKHPGWRRNPSISLLEYHKSWSWIMDVVDKIKSFHLYFTIDIGQYNFGCAINSMWVEDETIPWLTKFDESVCCLYTSEQDVKTPLEAANATIIKFIDWYNENK